MKLKLFNIITIVIIMLSGCAKQPQAEDVISAFKDAGLEAEDTRPMSRQDYGLAPYVCQGTRFYIPSLGPNNGGRFFICDNEQDRDALNIYYTELGKSNAMAFSWVFTRGNIVVQINGDLPEDKAHQYEAAIP